MNTMQNEADRRATLAARIAYRDELLELAAEAVAGRLDLRRMVDLHCDLNVFIDTNERRFFGVVGRLRRGLQDIGWTSAMGAAALAEYNAAPRSAATGEIVADGKCVRCGGAGRISAYSHISGGECFDCGGTGRADDGLLDHDD